MQVITTQPYYFLCIIEGHEYALALLVIHLKKYDRKQYEFIIVQKKKTMTKELHSLIQPCIDSDEMHLRN